MLQDVTEWVTVTCIGLSCYVISAKVDDSSPFDSNLIAHRTGGRLVLCALWSSFSSHNFHVSYNGARCFAGPRPLTATTYLTHYHSNPALSTGRHFTNFPFTPRILGG